MKRKRQLKRNHAYKTVTDYQHDITVSLSHCLNCIYNVPRIYEANIAQMYVGQGPLGLDPQPLGPTETYINKRQYAQHFSCQMNINVTSC